MTWTPERDEFALRLYRSGVTTTEIGKQIDKSQKAVSRRLLRLGVTMERKDSWTADQVTILRQHWGDLSASKIGKLIGKSKSAVLGKTNRLGLSGEPTTRKATPKIPEQRKTVLSIRPGFQAPRTNQCQWLYGEAKLRNFCCEPVRPGSSWCEDHYKECVAGHWKAEDVA